MNANQTSTLRIDPDFGEFQPLFIGFVAPFLEGTKPEHSKIDMIDNWQGSIYLHLYPLLISYSALCGVVIISCDLGIIYFYVLQSYNKYDLRLAGNSEIT